MRRVRDPAILDGRLRVAIPLPSYVCVWGGGVRIPTFLDGKLEPVMNYLVEVLYRTEIPWQPGYAGRAGASDYIKSDFRTNCDIKTTVISSPKTDGLLLCIEPAQSRPHYLYVS